MNAPAQVRRPAGLTLAIVMALLFFSMMSLIKLYIAWRFSECRSDVSYDCEVEFIPFDMLTKVQGLLGIILIVLAVMLWIGRPPAVRFLFQGTILLMIALLVIELIIRRNDSDPTNVPNNVMVISGHDAYIAILSQQVLFQVLAALYILWNCNRAPARAFLRQEPFSS